MHPEPSPCAASARTAPPSSRPCAASRGPVSPQTEPPRPPLSPRALQSAAGELPWLLRRAPVRQPWRRRGIRSPAPPLSVEHPQPSILPPTATIRSSLPLRFIKSPPPISRSTATIRSLHTLSVHKILATHLRSDGPDQTPVSVHREPSPWTRSTTLWTYFTAFSVRKEIQKP